MPDKNSNKELINIEKIISFLKQNVYNLLLLIIASLIFYVSEKWIIPCSLSAIGILLFLSISFLLRQAGFRKYKHFKSVQHYRWRWFFGIIIATFISVAIFRDYSIVNYPEYIKEIFEHADFLVILGLVFGVLACIIGMAVFEQVSVTNASNLKEFLIIFNNILSDAGKEDQIIALMPTYFIGGTGSVANVRTDFSVEHKDNLRELKSALKRGVKVHFFCLDQSKINYDAYLQTDKADAGRMNYVKNNLSIPLINFHYEISKDRFYGETTKVEEYFDHFYLLSKALTSDSKFTLTSLKDEYHKDERIVIIIKISKDGKNSAIFGSYTVEGGINLGGEEIKNSSAVKSLNQFFATIVNKHKVDTNFTFNY